MSIRLMQTSTGKKINPLNPDPSLIDPIDIAHHSANICRFGGACDPHYSVAQHSIFVASLLPDYLKPAGLMHDAAEAYVGDMIRPLKYQVDMYRFREIEDTFMGAIAHQFGIDPSLLFHPELKEADDIALVTEKRDLMPHDPEYWFFLDSRYTPVPQKITPWSHAESKQAWLKHFFILFGNMREH